MSTESTDLAALTTELRSYEERILDPLMRADPAQIRALLAPEFTEFSSGGHVLNRDAILAALACYRRTEIEWRGGDAEAARSALGQTQALLEQAPGSLAAEGLASIRKAYKIINLNKSKNWQYWLSQNISDWYTIKLLFLFV